MTTATATLKRAWALDLSNETLYELLKLRVEVFVVEQACAYPELDGRDLLADTRHFWLESGGQAGGRSVMGGHAGGTEVSGSVVCTLRLLEEHDDGEKSFRIGRLCTQRSARGQGHTTRLLRAALAEVGSAPCRINAQSYLVEMYAKHGFLPDGEETLEDGIPHTPMRRGGGSPWQEN